MEITPTGRPCGASIGIALISDTSDPQDCLRQADLALYRVKENGRGAYSFFEQEMDATVRFRRGLQADLHYPSVRRWIAAMKARPAWDETHAAFYGWRGALQAQARGAA